MIHPAVADRTTQTLGHVQAFGDAVKYAEESGGWVALPADSLVSMNMWGFTPSVFDELATRFRRFLDERAGQAKAEFYVPTVVSELIREGRARVRVLRTDERWYGVTYPQDRPALAAFIRDQVGRGRYPERLWT